MVHCVSETCKEELDQKWNFCPYCGTDNRPPEYRPRARNCRHDFVIVTGYCVDCGAKFGGSPSRSFGAWRIRLGVSGIVAGVVFLVGAYLIWRVHSQGHGPGYEWIRTWYDETYTRMGKYGNPVTRYRGVDVISWLSLIGLALIFIGIRIISPRRYYRSRLDDW